ncbi:MAG: radical SAM protein [Candidatus Nomurabacteria bacterium]|jgi:cyclic pyranopterin phosphate synthase|nr:radical SAM protein [Candidatus Nomurabacteria bacterium]
MKNRELRLLLTQNCNLDCFFCHKEGVHKRKKQILTNDDYGFLFTSCHKLYGWDTVTLSGGEPFLAKGFLCLMEKLKELGAKTTIVSNGTLLEQYARSKQLGDLLDKITISLHTTQSDIYKKITRGNFDIENIKENLKVLRQNNPELSIRINYTLLEDVNTKPEYFEEAIKFAHSIKASIRFIELCDDQTDYYPIEKVGEWLRGVGFIEIDKNLLQWYFSDGEVAVILNRIVCSVARALHTPTPHCNDTNSVFLSSDGTIKPCMMREFEISVLDEIKNRNILELSRKMNIFFDSIEHLCPYRKV